MPRLPEDVHMIAKTLVTIRIPNNSIRTAAERVVEAERVLDAARTYKRDRDAHLHTVHSRAMRLSNDPTSYDAQQAADTFAAAAEGFRTYYEASQQLAATRAAYDAACSALNALLVTPEERAELRRAGKPTSTKAPF